MKKEVAILIPNYNQKHYLRSCFQSLRNQTTHPDGIYYVDNASTDGSLELVQKNYPHVKVLKNSSNRGFAIAVNKGMRKVFRDGFRFCILLNPDVILHKDALRELLISYKTASKEKNIGLIQPVLLLQKKRHLINGIGNAIQYLGFGYCRDYLRRYRYMKKDKEIVFASGAVMLIAKDFYTKLGLLDDSFFLYCDDQDYSWRGLVAGYAHLLSVKALAYHDYSFGRYESKMYHFEKNRWTMLLKNYSMKTLILLSPVLLVLEIALLIYSLFHGFFVFKMKAYGYTITHLSDIRQKRKKIQKSRTVSDKVLLSRFDSDFDFFIMRKMSGVRALNFFCLAYQHFVLWLL